jgi:tRNA nucleotidyltransferase (CCA-adding enzyme)
MSVPPADDPRALRDALLGQLAGGARGVIATLAAEAPLYAVGGAVRDVILGRPVADIDLVSERDAIDLAQHALPETHLTTHTRFRTASLRIDGRRIDLATARSETYERPAALPRVAPAPIGDDLRRRDFAVNAVALRLSGDAALLDPIDGIADIHARRIRVLHDRSFIDDPTRIFRAHRYAARLGFTIDPHTRELLRQALPHIAALSAARVRRELELVIAEMTGAAALASLHEDGVLAAVHPVLAWDAPRSAALTVPPRWQVPWQPFGFALLSAGSSADEAESIDARLHLRRADAEAVRGIAALRQSAHMLARRDAKPSGVVVLLDRYPPASVAALAATAADGVVREIAHRYLAEWRHVKPQLSGRDLQEMGVPEGPRVQQGLQLIRAARLDGWARDRDDERVLVARFVKSIRDAGAMTGELRLHSNGH